MDFTSASHCSIKKPKKQWFCEKSLVYFTYFFEKKPFFGLPSVKIQKMINFPKNRRQISNYMLQYRLVYYGIFIGITVQK